jgi:hypothetical protein
LKASQIRGEKFLELRHGKIALKLKVLTVQQAADVYLDYRKLTVSQQMYNDESNCLKRFTGFFSPSSPIGEIKQKETESLILKLRVTNHLPKSKQANRQAVKPSNNPAPLWHIFSIVQISY